jgi:hypothetical protein
MLNSHVLFFMGKRSQRILVYNFYDTPYTLVKQAALNPAQAKQDVFQWRRTQIITDPQQSDP